MDFAPHIVAAAGGGHVAGSYGTSCFAAAAGSASPVRYPREASLRAALPTFDALVLIGRGEGGGAAAWEALASGVPALLVEATADGLSGSPYADDPLLTSALTLIAPTPSQLVAVVRNAASNRSDLAAVARERLGPLRAEFEAEWARILGEPMPPQSPPPTAAAPTSRLPHVAFLAYELAPVTPGGAGVVVGALAEALLTSGARVTVITHAMPCADAERWRIAAVGTAGSDAASRLRVVCVEAALAAEAAPLPRARHLHIRRAREFAAATRIAYDAAPFDVLEAFDFNGPAFELLRDRRARMTGNSASGAAAAAACGGVGRLSPAQHASASRPYLPASVPILVRAHGTIQLIDQAEAAADGSASAPTVARDALVYRMEQFCIAAADAVLAQSRAMAAHYAHAYRLPARQLALAPPPMQRILAPFAAARAAPTPTPPSLAAAAAASPPLLVVLGKLQRVKGTETVVDALARLHARRPDLPFRARFIGGDFRCAVHERPVSQCVAAMLPPSLRHAVELVGELPREAVPKALAAAVADGAVAAVAASTFETFCMAAHEAAAAGLPLVVADIAALGVDALEPLTAVARFRAGDADGLSRALEAVLEPADATAAALRRARVAPPPAYDRLGGPLDVYAAAAVRAADGSATLLVEHALSRACVAYARSSDDT